MSFLKLFQEVLQKLLFLGVLLGVAPKIPLERKDSIEILERIASNTSAVFLQGSQQEGIPSCSISEIHPGIYRVSQPSTLI